MKREEHFARIRRNRKVSFQQINVDESKRIAFYSPVTKGLGFLRECDIVPEERCLPSHENNRSTDSGRRDNPTDTVEFSMQSNNQSTCTNIDLSRNNYDVNDTYGVNDDDDDDNHSTTSAYTYASVDTTATSESVQSIISMLQSETERRKRLLQRRRRAIRAMI